MSTNSQSLSGDPLVPLQRVSLNSSKTNLVLDSDSGTSSFVVSTGAATSLYIDKFSNVGINTKSPTAQLEVASGNGACLRLRYGATSSISTMSMNAIGDMKIEPTGKITTPATLVLTNHNGVDTGLVLGSTLVKASGIHLNYTMATPGQATASTALVLDANRDIANINSITAAKVKGEIQDAAQPKITSVGTLSQLEVSGVMRITSTAEATSYTEGGALTLAGGALGVDGGLAVAKNIYVGTDLYIAGDMYVAGTSTVVNSSTMAVDDNTMTVNSSPIMANDAGLLIGRFQKPNNTGSGSVVSDTPDFTTSVVSATTTTIQLDAGAATSSYYNDWWVRVGAGDVRKVSAYDASTKTITVATAFTTTPSNGAVVNLFGRNFAGMIWNDSNKRFAAMMVPRDDTTGLNSLGYADMAMSKGFVQSTADSALVVAGGATIAKPLYANGGVYGSMMTAAQPNITSLGKLTSLEVEGEIKVSNVDGTIKTAAQPNITSVGTLNGLAVSTNAADALTIANTASTSSNVKFSSGSLSGSLGVNGTTSTMAMMFDSNPVLVANASGNISIGTSTMGYKLNVGGNLNATAYNLNGTGLAMNLLSGSIAAGSASASKVLSTDADLNVSGVNQMTLTTLNAQTIDTHDLEVDNVNATNIAGTITTAAQPNITSVGALTSLTIGSSEISSTDASRLSSLTVGQAAPSKAMVLDEQKAIYGIKTIGLEGADVPLAMTNVLSAGMVSQSMTTNRYTMNFGVRGSTYASDPDTAFWSFNGKKGILMNSLGEVAINAGTFGYGLNVNGSINATGFYLNGVSFDAGVVQYISDVSPGSATASRSLIVDADRNITNINSLTASKLIVGTTDLQGLIDNASIISGITAGQASPSKALVVDANSEISNISKVSTTALKLGATSIVESDATFLKNLAGGTTVVDATRYKQGGVMLDFSDLPKLSGVEAGAAAFSKALILGPTGNISGIGAIGVSSVEFGSQVLTSTEAGYLTGITPGQVANSKALIASSMGGISGIKSMNISGPLTLSNIDSTDKVSQTMTSDVYSLEVGVRGSTNATNPNMAFIRYNATDQVLINSAGKVAVGTTTFDQKFNVGGAINATDYYVNGTKLQMVGQEYLTGIQVGSAVESTVVVLDSNKSVSGINSIGATTLVLGTESLTSAEAARLTSITAGTAKESKAVVLDANKKISGLASVGITGDAASLLTLTNVNPAMSAAQTITSDTKSLIIGVNGSTATNADMAFIKFDGADRMIFDDNGNVGVGKASGAFKLDVNGIVNATDFYINGSKLDVSGAGAASSYLTGLTIGQASPSKALVLDANSDITGIGRAWVAGIMTGGGNYDYANTDGANKFASFNGMASTMRNTSGGTDSTHRATYSFNGAVMIGQLTTTTTKASTIYIPSAPTQGSNMTISNSYGLYLEAGCKSYFGGNIEGAGNLLLSGVGSTLTLSGNGSVLTLTGASSSLTLTGNTAAVGLTGTSSYISISNTSASTGSGSGAIRSSGGIYAGADSYFAGKITTTRLITLGTSYTYTNAGTNDEFSLFRGKSLTTTNGDAAASATDATHRSFYEFNQPTLAAINTNVKTTNASTMYISGAPANGTNMTVTNAHALYVNAGLSRFPLIRTFNSAATWTTTTTLATYPMQIVSDGAGNGNTTGIAFLIDNNFTAAPTSWTPSAAIQVVKASGFGAADMVFFTRSTVVGATDPIAERMRITQAGNIQFASGSTLVISNTSGSTSSSTGAIQCAGGIYSGASSYFTSSVSVGRLLTLQTGAALATANTNNDLVAPIQMKAITFTSDVAASGTDATHRAFVELAAPTIAANNLSATTTNASTLYISGAPINGTNMTIANPYAIYVNTGVSRFTQGRFTSTSITTTTSSNATAYTLNLINESSTVGATNGISFMVDNAFPANITTMTPSAVIQAIRTTGTYATADLVFYTRSAGSTTTDAIAERMRITQTGVTKVLKLSSGGTAYTYDGAVGSGFPLFQGVSTTITNSTSAAFSSDGNIRGLYEFTNSTIAATNASVTTTVAATMYIPGIPIPGTNMTIANRFAIYCSIGISRFVQGRFHYSTSTTTSSNASDYCLSLTNATSTVGANTGISFTVDSNVLSYASTTAITPSAAVIAQRVTGTYATADLVFMTRSSGASITSALSERMRITQDGILKLTNSETTSTSRVVQRLSSDTQTLEFGVNASTYSTNPSMAYWNFGGLDRILMNTSGNIGFGTTPDASYALNVSGSVNATSFYIDGTQIDVSTLGATAGQATASKALIVGSDGKIANLKGVSISDTTTGNRVAQIIAASSNTLEVGVGGSTSTTPNLAYWNFGGADRMLMSATGYVGINKTPGSTYMLEVGGSINATELYAAGTKIDTSVISTANSYLNGLTAGQATNSKALIVGSDGKIAGLVGISIADTTSANRVAQTITSDANTLEFGVGGSTSSAANLAYWKYGGADRMLMSATGYVGIGKTPGSTHLLDVNGSVNATDFYVNGTKLDSAYVSAGGYLVGITEGLATPSKALVVGSDGKVAGLVGISITDTTTANRVSQTIVSDSTTLEVGVGGSTSDAANLAFWKFGGVDRMLMSSTGFLGIGKTPGSTHLLDVNGSVNATNFYVSGTKLEASYLIGTTVGQATPSKAIIVGSDGKVAGLVGLSITDTTTANRVSQSIISDSKTLEFGVGGSASSIANLAYWKFGGADRILMNDAGNVGFNKSPSATYAIDVNGTVNATDFYISGSKIDLSTLNAYFSGVTAGQANASKALVVGSDGKISLLKGINITDTTTANRVAQTITTSNNTFEFGVGGSASATANMMYWNFGGSDRLLMDTSGNIGIGKTPSTKLDVNGTTSSTDLVLSSTIASTDSSTGALRSSGGIYVGADSLFAGKLTLSTGALVISNSTAATASNAAAVQVSGGLYAGGDSLFGGKITCASLFVGGQQITSGGGSSSTSSMPSTAITGNVTIGSSANNIGFTWNSQKVPGSGNYGLMSVCWAPEISTFVAISYLGGSPSNARALTSYDGVNWAVQTLPNNNNWWVAVCWSPTLRLFAAVSQTSNSGSSVCATSPDGINWTERTTAPTSIPWLSVCWSSSLAKFVAVGSGAGAVMTSSDGISWSVPSGQNITWSNTSYGSICWSSKLGLFVAVSAYGINRLITSSDGTTWTQQNVPSEQWKCVVWSPELNLFVALAENATTISAITSSDGITWNSRTASISSWYSICWASEVSAFVAVATSGKVMISSDGINWSTIASPPAIALSSICWSPKLMTFVAVAYTGGNNQIITASGYSLYDSNNAYFGKNVKVANSIQSQKMITKNASVAGGVALTTATRSSISTMWSPISSVPDYSFSGICWSPELSLFVAIGELYSVARVSLSKDGINWVTKTPFAGSLIWSAICWSPELMLFAACAKSGTNLLMTSPNGITWTNQTSPTGPKWYSICWSPELRLFVTVGSTSDGTAAAIATSSDGVTWTSRTIATTIVLSSVCWSPELTLFAACGNAGATTTTRILTSPDGITWTTRTLSGSWNSICWSPELMMFATVSGSTSDTNRIATSYNGTSWTTSLAPGSNLWQSICWSSELSMFMAVANTTATPTVNQTSMCSVDGNKWKLIGTINKSDGTFNPYWTAVCWSPELMKFVAVANSSGINGKRMMSWDAHSLHNPSTSYFGNNVKMNRQLSAKTINTTSTLNVGGVVSQDVTNLRWATQTSPNDYPWSSICWAPEIMTFVAVANSAAATTIAKSNNGLYWTSSTIAAAVWTSVCWSPELKIFVAVGTAGSIATSPTGSTWTVRNASATWLNFNSVCWSPELGLFVAIGSSGVNTSPDGITWTSQTVPGSAWRSICWSPELGIFVTLSGNEAVTAVSSDGITWTSYSFTSNLFTGSSICWSPQLGIFVGVSEYGNASTATITSADGINWTYRTVNTGSDTWKSVCWSAELGIFVAVASAGSNLAMTSTDGISWVMRPNSQANQWMAVCWAPELMRFVAVSATGTGTRVSTLEGCSITAQGSVNVGGNLSIGTNGTFRAPLTINTISTLPDVGTYYRLTNSTTISTASTAPTAVSMYTAGRIVCLGEVDVISDARAKSNIKPITVDVANKFIDEIVPKSFSYKSEKQRTSFGYIAQDLIGKDFTQILSVAPDQSMTEYVDENGFTSPANVRFGIVTGNIIPLLHMKVKSLSDEAKAAKDENEQLRDKVDTLEARLAALEALLQKSP